MIDQHSIFIYQKYFSQDKVGKKKYFSFPSFWAKSISSSYMGSKAWGELGSSCILMKVFDSLKAKGRCDMLEYFAFTNTKQQKRNFNDVSAICTQVAIQSHKKFKNKDATLSCGWTVQMKTDIMCYSMKFINKRSKSFILISSIF